MKIADPTIVTHAAAPPVTPVAPEAVRPLLEGGKAARERRDAYQQQQERGTSFRAALDAATVGGLGQAFGGFTADTSVSADTPRPERRPAPHTELDAAEADGLYRAAQGKSAPSPARFSREHFTASREYAQRFFSVDRTYAARGETLELRA